MSYITRALKDSPPRVYLLLIDAKLKALRSLTAAKDASKSCKQGPEVIVTITACENWSAF